MWGSRSRQRPLPPCARESKWCLWSRGAQRSFSTSPGFHMPQESQGGPGLHCWPSGPVVSASSSQIPGRGTRGHRLPPTCTPSTPSPESQQDPPAAPHRVCCPFLVSLLVGDEAGAAVGMHIPMHGATVPCQADSPSAMTAHGEKQQQQGKNREKNKIRINPLRVVSTLCSLLSEPRQSPVNSTSERSSLSFWQ